MTEPKKYLLRKFPRLRDVWPKTMVNKLTSLDHRYNWATASHPEADSIRQQLEDALEWASRNSFLSADLKGRLRGTDQAHFHSAKDELLIGKFLTRVGCVKPAYILPNGRVGDWLIDGEPPIYVEVKSVYDFDNDANRTHARLRQAAHGVASGRVLEAEVSATGTLTSIAHFQGHLERCLASLPLELTDEVELPAYVDPSGMTVSLTGLPLQSDGPTTLVIFYGGSGPITSHLRVQESARRGAPQLPVPGEGVPGMVVVCRHSDIPDTGLELLGAVFSLPAINLETGEFTAQLAGLSQQARHTRVSAVAQYFDRPEKLEVVHNPFAKNPIDPVQLSFPEIRQLVPDGPGRMRWIGNEAPQ